MSSGKISNMSNLFTAGDKIPEKVPYASNMEIIDGFDDHAFFKNVKAPADTVSDVPVYKKVPDIVYDANPIPAKHDYAKGLMLESLGKEADDEGIRICLANKMLKYYKNPFAAEEILKRKLTPEEMMLGSVSLLNPTEIFTIVGKAPQAVGQVPFPTVKKIEDESGSLYIPVEDNSIQSVPKPEVIDVLNTSFTSESSKEEIPSGKEESIDPYIETGLTPEVADELVKELEPNDVAMSKKEEENLTSDRPPEYKAEIRRSTIEKGKLDLINSAILRFYAKSDSPLGGIGSKSVSKKFHEIIRKYYPVEKYTQSELESLPEVDRKQYNFNKNLQILSKGGSWYNWGKPIKKALISALATEYPDTLKIVGDGIKRKGKKVKKEKKPRAKYFKPDEDVNKDIEFAMNRLQVLLGSIGAGNTGNKMLGNEMSNIIDYLLMHGALDKKTANKLTKLYVK